MPIITTPRPTPNLEIYDFEGDLEPAFAAAFAEALNIQAAKQRDSAKLVTPRVEVQLRVGTQTQRAFYVPGTNWGYQQEWKGTMRAVVVTSRKADLEQPRHGLCLAAVRRFSEDYNASINPRLKYLSISQLMASGTNGRFESTNDEDHSELEFAITFQIKQSAFPAP